MNRALLSPVSAYVRMRVPRASELMVDPLLGSLKQQIAEEKRRLQEHAEFEKGETPKLIRSLLRNGWYVSMEIRCDKWQKMLKHHSDPSHLDQIMVEFSRRRITEDSRGLEDNWPERWTIIKDAIDAHGQGKFTLSVPALITQAEGMFRDIFHSPYGPFEPKTDKTWKLITSHLQSDEHRVQFGTAGERLIPLNFTSDSFIRFLEFGCSIGDWWRFNHGEPKDLNRHAVLHGVSTKYPTETNSLKAFMAVDFMNSAKTILSRHIERVSEIREEMKHLFGEQ